MRTPAELVEQLRNAKPPKLRTGDTRIMRRDPEPGRPYFVREIFRAATALTATPTATGHSRQAHRGVRTWPTDGVMANGNGGHRLTPKQQAFVQEYLVDLNASAAYLRAGYVTNNADVHGPAAAGKTLVSRKPSPRRCRTARSGS